MSILVVLSKYFTDFKVIPTMVLQQWVYSMVFSHLCFPAASKVTVNYPKCQNIHYSHNILSVDGVS